jgi:hypothetical protein
MSDETPYYDITEGDWRVIATPSGGGDARIDFTYKGDPFRSLACPAYRVWNIPAHMTDIVADFEAGMRVASWPDFPSLPASQEPATDKEQQR